LFGFFASLSFGFFHLICWILIELRWRSNDHDEEVENFNIF